MNPLLANAFVDELEKLSWGGTYYHGAPSAVEEKILQEGLRTSRGGTGAVHEAVKRFGPDHPLARRFKKNTKQQVSMSRSKNLARIYGTALDPKRRRDFIAALQSGKQSKPGVRGWLEASRRGIETLQSYQPLAVEGRGLTLRRDPDHLLLAVQSGKNVPASRISRSTPRAPGRLGKVLKALKRFR
jgi:hypothetical protein